VSVTAERRPDGQGPGSWRLTLRTDFLKDVPIEDERFVELAALSAHLAALTYAWVYPPAEVLRRYEIRDRPKLWLLSTAYLSRPEGAKLDGLDPILEAAELVYAPMGNETNRWVGAGEFATIAERWGRSDLCFGIGDAEGLTLETPFGQDSALIRLRTNERHPQLGTGLLGTIQLPIGDELGAAAHECARLNLMETFWTDIPLFGCWSPHQSRDAKYCLAFTSFIPNALYSPGLASNMAGWLFQRAHWVRKERFALGHDRTMLEILLERFGISGDPSDQFRSNLH
jgi:hypothetical protein